MSCRTVKSSLFRPRAVRSSALAALPAAALFCAATALAADPSWGERKLLETFVSLEQESIEPAKARDDCRLYVNALPEKKGTELREMVAGLLDVEETAVSPALCDAMVDLNVAGDVRTTQIEAIARTDDEAFRAFELGRIMRAIYFVHLTANAEGAAQ